MLAVMYVICVNTNTTINMQMLLRALIDRYMLYLEKGAGPRPSLCVYDRKNSAIAEANSADFDWPTILKGAAAFHFTGITPALSKNCASLCLQAVKAARKLGVTVTCDLNFRKKLWTRAQAKKTMTELCKYVDVCILNEEYII